MGTISGNILATVQRKTTSKNAIGSVDVKWNDVGIMKGWIDLITGDSRHTTFNAKMQESTHVFIADYSELTRIPCYLDLKPENTRISVNSSEYEVTLIDNPMELKQHIEIYLKKVGG